MNNVSDEGDERYSKNPAKGIRITEDAIQGGYQAPCRNFQVMDRYWMRLWRVR